jgi:hypothetical protein
MLKRRRIPQKKQEPVALRFPSVPLIELPAGNRKHGKIVSQVLNDLRKLEEDQVLKIDLRIAGGPKKADLRSALHRAAKKEGLELATISDYENLYVFRRRVKAGTSRL